MANSRFYYYPGTNATGATPLQPVDLGRRAAVVDDLPAPIEFAVGNMAGGEVVQTWAVDLQVTITAEGIPAGDNQRQLASMVSHLRRGGIIGFALDHAKFWCATRTGGLSLAAGSDLSAVILGGPYWRAWQSSPTLGSGDEVAIEGFEGRRTVQGVSSVPAYTDVYANIVLDGNLPTSLTDFVVRERYSYPALRLTPDGRRAPLLATTNGHTWSLNLPLTVARDVLARPTATILSPLPGTSGAPATTGTAYGPRE